MSELRLPQRLCDAEHPAAPGDALHPVQRTLPLSLDVLAEAVAGEIGQDIGDDVPVYLEAWGGHGGKGGAINQGNSNGGDGGAGGAPGYARSSHTFGALSD